MDEGSAKGKQKRGTNARLAGERRKELQEEKKKETGNEEMKRRTDERGHFRDAGERN